MHAPRKRRTQLVGASQAVPGKLLLECDFQFGIARQRGDREPDREIDLETFRIGSGDSSIRGMLEGFERNRMG